MAEAVVAIAEFLGSLGLRETDAERARAVLEADGITNPRKARLSAAKLERAGAVIDARIPRFCAPCAERIGARGREVASVPASGCTRCGGSRNDRALRAGGGVRVRRDRADRDRRGSPDTRRELGALRGGPEPRLVDATERRTCPEAQRDLAWANLVVIGVRRSSGTRFLHARPRLDPRDHRPPTGRRGDRRCDRRVRQPTVVRRR